MRLLTNWISSYLQLVNDTEPPGRFHLWTAITIIGAMMGRKCTLQLGPELFFPNLYTVLVGPPGVRKGTAIKYGTGLMSQVKGATMAPDAVTKEQLCKEMEQAQAQENIDGEILSHSSLFVVAPELVVFIKENDHERLGYLCQLYDGLDRFEYKTKTSINAYVVNPGLWILGATTPNWIEIAMKQLGTGGGMTSRIVFVYAANKGKHIPATQMKPFDTVLRSKLIADLNEIKQMSGKFSITQEADTFFAKWYMGVYKDTKLEDSRLASYWQRLPSMVIKVAMIVSASKRTDKTVTEQDIRSAIRMFELITPDMAQAFGGLGQNTLGTQTEMIRNILRDRGTASKSHIMRTLRHALNEWDYQRCKNSLIAEKFCRRDFSQADGEELLICLEKKTVTVSLAQAHQEQPPQPAQSVKEDGTPSKPATTDAT